MTQIRLFRAAPRAAALAAHAALEAAFEEDGLPVAAFEVDGAGDCWAVSVYVSGAREAEIAERMAAALERVGLGTQIGREALGETDWVAATLRELAPVRAGRFVVHGSHDRAAPRACERAIEIDAALAFGTGHHGTTAGCLDMLDALFKQRRFARALDIGTGTGVLAIAAARATPARVVASDIDPVATATARANCRLNGVASRVACLTAAGLRHPAIARAGPFDLVMANILARPLEAMARDLARACAPGATLILSGLLAHQRARIVAAYRAQGLVFVRAHLRDGWLTLVMRRRLPAQAASTRPRRRRAA
ncbi:MAG: ribosomal protein L11 methyltransferase [Alphaproteobacteria bacterium]|nr:MAG: ribosomal protein L11 methyltransferase [Alphaproteobacteria bacterium]